MNVTEVVSAVASHMTRSVLGKLSQAGSVHAAGSCSVTMGMSSSIARILRVHVSM